jgi:hypothetical protein
MARTLVAIVLFFLSEAFGDCAGQGLSASDRNPNPEMPEAARAAARGADADVNGKHAQGLKIRLELESRRANEAVVEWDAPFGVLVVNESDQPIRIWDPNSRQGWNQWTVRFVNPRTGRTHVARRRTIDDPEYWKAASDRRASDTGIVEIAARKTFETSITLREFALGTHRDRGPAHRREGRCECGR